MVEEIEVITGSVLAGIPHGFLGRQGGISTGVVAGLNVGLGSGDEPATIAENRRLAAEAVFPGAPLVGVYQVHSADCVIVSSPWRDDARPQADALVTDRRGILLGIVTADCAPVLLADREAGVVGAAHAGWKGALHGIIDRTIEAMVALGARPSAMAATIGPCIAQQSYEVNEGFAVRFRAEDQASERFMAPGREGHWQFDLEGYVGDRLESAGVGLVEKLGLDTYAEPRRFYSFRRSTHRHELAYGRQISLIGLPGGVETPL